MSRQAAFVTAVLVAAGTATIAALPAGADHQTGGFKQSAAAILKTPIAATVEPELCVNNNCNPLGSHPVDARQVELSLEYVLASTTHVSDVASQAGEKLYTCSSPSTPNGWGVKLGIGKADLQRNSYVDVNLNGVLVKRIPEPDAENQMLLFGGLDVSLRVICTP